MIFENRPRIYFRSKMDVLPPAESQSEVYSRSQARKAFERFPSVNWVEYVPTGCKLDSTFMHKGEYYAPDEVYVIISSTGGRWGKSRRDFAPKEGSKAT